MPLPTLSDFLDGSAEALVPTGTFGNGPHAHKTLRCARICIFGLYSIIVLLLLMTVATFILGRVEIVDHRMKYDRLEAPSLAICPWQAGAAVKQRQGASYDAYAVKHTLEGKLQLPVKPTVCKFDRTCYCLDLSTVNLEDVDESHTGMTGQKSEREETFRERIEIHTSLTDPSPAHTLKFGLYDSRDPRPSWFLGKEGGFQIGQLRLDSWMLSETSFQMIERALLGHKPKFWRHFYSYNSNDAQINEKDEDGQPFTRLSYEFKTFFVVETISSYRSMSIYGLVSVIFLLVAVSNLLVIWDNLFPIAGMPGQVQRRSVARPVKWLVRKLFGEELGGEFEAAPPEKVIPPSRQASQAFSEKAKASFLRADTAEVHSAAAARSADYGSA